ncbi:unnamed protein product [Bursaphelenchus okinawaensis]|uniref:Uncharacterized protein n=1 Tax=Bursaphelenchus okinawaensis TaxID=465554 RepID=A0A811K8K1_9BILA|nr:unnamed protein product [Bursaphelenchus okinawaensis]CAG9096203.1 unnamed protein product [Bursaphelenchus okinawaensis]
MRCYVLVIITVSSIAFLSLQAEEKECRDAFSFNYISNSCSFLHEETFYHSMESREMNILHARNPSETDETLAPAFLGNNFTCLAENKVHENAESYHNLLYCQNIPANFSLQPAEQFCFKVAFTFESKYYDIGHNVRAIGFDLPELSSESFYDSRVDTRFAEEFSSLHGCAVHFDVRPMNNTGSYLDIFSGSTSYVKDHFMEKGLYKIDHTVKSHITRDTSPAAIDHFFSLFRRLDTRKRKSLNPFIPDHRLLTDHLHCHYSDAVRSGGFKELCRVTQLIVNMDATTALNRLERKFFPLKLLILDRPDVKVEIGVEVTDRVKARRILIIYCDPKQLRYCDREFAHDMRFIGEMAEKATVGCYSFSAEAEPFYGKDRFRMAGLNQKWTSPVRGFVKDDSAFCTSFVSSYRHYHLKKFKIPLKRMYYGLSNNANYTIGREEFIRSVFRNILTRLNDDMATFIYETSMSRSPKGCTKFTAPMGISFFKRRRKIVFCVCLNTDGVPCNSEETLFPYVHTMTKHPYEVLRNDRKEIEKCIGEDQRRGGLIVKPNDPELQFDYSIDSVCVLQRSNKYIDVVNDRFEVYRYDERDLRRKPAENKKDAPYVDQNSWAFKFKHERIADEGTRALFSAVCQHQDDIIKKGCKCMYIAAKNDILCCCGHKDMKATIEYIDDKPPIHLSNYYQNMVPVLY